MKLTLYFGADQKTMVPKLIEKFEKDFPGELLSWDMKVDFNEIGSMKFLKYDFDFKTNFGPYYFGFSQAKMMLDFFNPIKR